MTTIEGAEGGLMGIARPDEPSLVPEVIETRSVEPSAEAERELRGLFSGRRALVTGGGSGIGLATVRRLLAEGAQVVAADLDPAAAVAEGADPVVCDVTDPESVAAAAAQAEPLDLLVANAGIAPPARELWDVEPEEFDAVMAVNVRGVFLTLRAVLPGMVERGSGAVVVTSSAAGLRGVNWFGTYCASKHAVVGLVRSVALDVADQGVRVNAVCPGSVKTPILGSMRATSEDLLGRIRRAGTTLVPMDRLGDAEEIARVITFLLSEDASFMTGAAVAVDGGHTAGAMQKLVSRAVDPEM